MLSGSSWHQPPHPHPYPPDIHTHGASIPTGHPDPLDIHTHQTSIPTRHFCPPDKTLGSSISKYEDLRALFLLRIGSREEWPLPPSMGYCALYMLLISLSPSREKSFPLSDRITLNYSCVYPGPVILMPTFQTSLSLVCMRPLFLLGDVLPENVRCSQWRLNILLLSQQTTEFLPVDWASVQVTAHCPNLGVNTGSLQTVTSQSSPGTPQGHLSPRYSLYPQMDLTHKATHNAATWPLLLTPFQGCWDPFLRIESHQSLASLQSDNGPAFVSQIIQVSEVTFKFYSACFKSLERNNNSNNKKPVLL